MLVCEIWQDVTGGQQVQAQVGKLPGIHGGDLVLPVVRDAHHIRLVVGDVVLAGQMPAAKAILQRDLVPLHIPAVRFQARSGTRDQQRLGDQSRQPPCGIARMAVHAFGGARYIRHRPSGAQAVKDIKHGPHLGICGDDFHHPARHPAEVGVFVEVQGAWVARIDDLALQRTGGKHQGLRADGDVQRRQQAGEEGLVVRGVQLHVPLLRLLLKLGKAILRLPFKVGMGRPFEIDDAQFLRLRCRSGGDRQKQQHRQESGTHHALYACEVTQIAADNH